MEIIFLILKLEEWNGSEIKGFPIKLWKKTLKEVLFMAIEYLGLSEINGPLIALEGVKDAAFDEIVEFLFKE